MSLLMLACCCVGTVRAVDPPPWLPRYDLDIVLEPAQRTATVKQRVTFTNRHQRPANELTFNVHGRYTIPDGQVGFMAKMAEMLRVSPKEAFYFDGPPLDVKQVFDCNDPKQRIVLRHHYDESNPCSMVVPLNRPVGPGETVTVELWFEFKIPAKKGRWSCWEDVTALAQWLPTIAVYDEQGWHALPFIPWHQPFYNEAGVYTARVTAPQGHKLALPVPIRSEKTIDNFKARRFFNRGGGDGLPQPEARVLYTEEEEEVPGNWVQYELEPAVLRDFSLTCSSRYQLIECQAGKTTVRCLYLPQHEHYAKIFLETACKALPVYERWFGPYPYAQFTIAEASFGWNGNECSGMVLIDDRMFNMPHIAKAYPIYLIQHELCHQWFYNLIGTNGYGETFVDEGLATHFSHKLADETLGRNNAIIDWPAGLGWMPNIHREDFRYYGMIGSRARGEIYPTVQPIDKFGHLGALLANTYDRGGKIFGQIEARLGGEEAMFDFMRGIYRKYAYRILRVADLQCELEAYTGKSWDDFFRHWVYGSGMCDWKVQNIEVNGHGGPLVHCKRRTGPVQLTIDLVEQEGFPEPTVLGIQLTNEKDRFDIRIPIDPSVPIAEFPEYNCRIESRVIEPAPSGHKLLPRLRHGHAEKPAPACKYAVRVVMTAPCQPTQVVVDPDRVLIDSKPHNNQWIPHIHWRPTPLYTQLDEVDVTNTYDRWSIIFGPWIGTSTSIDPWYTRSPLAGFKAGTVRIQELTAGAFVGYRTNDSNVVAGIDGIWSHVGIPQLYFGFNLEKSLTSLDANPHASRGVIYSRYVLLGSTSLFMQPFEYVETFAAAQDHPLPTLYTPIPGANPFYQRNSVGMHYHKYFLTPYWDAEGGLALDVSYQCGVPIFGMHDEFQLVQGQFSSVTSFPSWITDGHDGPIMNWLKETRFAYRVAGGAAAPQDGQFFALGGGDNFRGFTVRQRQGSLTWLTSVEWRVPVLQRCCHDYIDHIASVRNVYLAPFYDVGQAYLNGQGIGNVAQAVGLGLRVDVQWTGIIERTMLRVDVAQAIGQGTPVQVWLGIMHPF